MSVDHSTTIPLRDIAQKKAKDNLGYVKQGISSKDERATAAFLWDITCSTFHPYFRNMNSNLNGCKLIEGVVAVMEGEVCLSRRQ